MRLRALLAGLALLILSAMVFTAGAGRGPAPVVNVSSRSTAAPSVPSTSPAFPERNVFEYADEETPRPAAEQQRFLPAPPESQPAIDAPLDPGVPVVRLIGFVRRGGSLKAAVALRDSVYVLGVGEQAEGYTLLAADEDAGVRIQGPEGLVLTLPPAS